MFSDKEMYELAEQYLEKGDEVFEGTLYAEEFRMKIINLANEMKQHEAEIAADVAAEELQDEAGQQEG